MWLTAPRKWEAGVAQGIWLQYCWWLRVLVIQSWQFFQIIFAKWPLNLDFVFLKSRQTLGMPVSWCSRLLLHQVVGQPDPTGPTAT